MYHSRFKKNHYGAGYKWGSLLYQHNVDLKNNVMFAQDEQRKRFALECIPIYETWFPEVLQEIKGIADGSHVPEDMLQTFLLGMYCFTFDNHCTCMVCADDDHILFGRNSDFLVHLEKQYDSCYYHYDDRIPFIGNTTAFTEIEDGINAHGLAIGLTFIGPTPSVRKPGFQAGILVRYLLETCHDVKEALSILHQIPIGSAQTLTMADPSGSMIIVECNSEKVMEIKSIRDQRPFIVTANNFNTKDMQDYQRHDLDDWRSKERYQNAYHSLKDAKQYSFSLIQDILSGKHGFMCQYDRSTNADTVWSCIYDLKNKKIYRCEGNPGRRNYKEDHRLTFL